MGDGNGRFSSRAFGLRTVTACANSSRIGAAQVLRVGIAGLDRLYEAWLRQRIWRNIVPQNVVNFVVSLFQNRS